MSTIECIRALVDYHYALYDRVWESVVALSDEQFLQHKVAVQDPLHPRHEIR